MSDISSTPSTPSSPTHSSSVAVLDARSTKLQFLDFASIKDKRHQEVDIPRFKGSLPIWVDRPGSEKGQSKYVGTVHFKNLGVRYNLQRYLSTGSGSKLYVVNMGGDPVDAKTTYVGGAGAMVDEITT